MRPTSTTLPTTLPPPDAPVVLRMESTYLLLQDLESLMRYYQTESANLFLCPAIIKWGDRSDRRSAPGITCRVWALHKLLVPAELLRDAALTYHLSHRYGYDYNRSKYSQFYEMRMRWMEEHQQEIKKALDSTPVL